MRGMNIPMWTQRDSFPMDDYAWNNPLRINLSIDVAPDPNTGQNYNCFTSIWMNLVIDKIIKKSSTAKYSW